MLPPMLSPTLPAQFMALPEPLSPTLPAEFNDQLLVKLKYDQAPGAASAAEAAKPATKPASRTSSSTRRYSSSDEGETPKPAKAKLVTKPSAESKRHEFWLGHARTKKHESDALMASRKHQEAVVRVLDSIICFLKGFYWEDMVRKAQNKSHAARTWETMLPHLSERILYLESVDAEIAGVCYFIRAVCGLHVAKSVKHYKEKKTPAGVELSKVLVDVVGDFSNGLMYLPLESVTSKYNLNWTGKKRGERMDPASDECVLPLHANSTIQDAAAFGYRVAAEWAKHENLDYEWVCIEKDP